MENWTKANRLTLNVAKTNSIVFANMSPLNPPPPFILENKIVSVVSSTKFLGVLLDHKLTFGDHINSVISKVSRNTGIFYHIRDCLSLKAKLSFFHMDRIFDFPTYTLEGIKMPWLRLLRSQKSS